MIKIKIDSVFVADRVVAGKRRPTVHVEADGATYYLPPVLDTRSREAMISSWAQGEFILYEDADEKSADVLRTGMISPEVWSRA